VSRGQRLRILSYNIQVGIATSRYRHYLTHGWKHVLPYRGRSGNLDRIAHFISAFDVVGLQELDAGSLRSNFQNQAEYLAQRSGIHHWCSQTNRNFGQLAKHSLGLVSRFPILLVREHKLPGTIPGRGAMEVHFGAPDSPLVVVLAHLSLGRRTRSRQLGYLAELISRRRHAVLMGDFNCRPSSLEFRHLLQSTELCEPHYAAHTYPSWRPMHGFDHILVTPDLEVEHSNVFQVGYSDHLPVGLDLLLPEDLRLDFHPRATEGLRAGAAAP
jgi:endonuclease/exonuclease/phosphatase family metal-dependent hydrolase